jgi:flagellar export protein FliJ
MKGFVFSLQALLILRQRQERVALEHYGRALHARAAAWAAVQQAQQDLARSWSTLRTELENTCCAARAAFHRAQCTALEERSRRAQAQAQSAEHVVRETLSAFTEARRQREAVDRVRERRHRAFERDRARQEGRILDDLAGRCAKPRLNGQPAQLP